MKPLSHAIGALLTLLALDAQAQFDGLERFTGLQVAGLIQYQDYDIARSRTQSDGLSMHSADVNALPLTLTLPPLELSAPLFTAMGQVHAEQTSMLTGSVLSYAARATASMGGEALIGVLDGHSSGRSNFMATFGVAESSVANLHMASVLDQPAATYSFRLIRQTDGTVIWDKTSVVDAGGSVLSDFTTTFNLAPGFYELTTTVLAQAGLDPTVTSSASSAVASFELSISPVPELSELVLLPTGLIAMWAVARRRTANTSRAHGSTGRLGPH